MRIVTVVCVFCVLALTGCGRRSQEKIIEKAMENKVGVDIAEDSISIQGKDGKFSMSAGKNTKVPPNFPSDVPIYEGAELLMAMEIEDGHTLQLKTKDDMAKVAQTYLKAMDEKKWVKTSNSESAGQQILHFSKNNRIAIVSVAKQPDATYVAMVISKKSSD